MVEVGESQDWDFEPQAGESVDNQCDTYPCHELLFLKRNVSHFSVKRTFTSEHVLA